MAAAARIHVVEKGKDPRRYALVGFGGAGPAHAAGVARILGIGDVIVPPASGAASCLGFLAAPLSFEHARSHPVRLVPGFDAPAVNRILAELEKDGRALLAQAGVAPADMTVERTADMRLVGQMHEINVPLPEGGIDDSALDDVRAAFAEVYARRYTAVYADAAIEAISFRVRVVGPAPPLDLDQAQSPAPGQTKRKGARQAWFGDGFVAAAVYDRYALAPGDRIEGPAIIEEREATTVVPPGDRLTVDAHLNLRIAVAVAAPAPALITAATPLAEAMGRIEADPLGHVDGPRP
jgi:5-oxoprolinase (ATP-hydrolysing)/N-methylhydantoinase A